MSNSFALKWALIGITGVVLVAAGLALFDGGYGNTQTTESAKPLKPPPTGRDPVARYRAAWRAAWVAQAGGVIVVWFAVVFGVGLGRRRTGVILVAIAVASATTAFAANAVVGGIVLSAVSNRGENGLPRDAPWQYQEEERFERSVGLGGLAMGVVFAGSLVVWQWGFPPRNPAASGPVRLFPN